MKIYSQYIVKQLIHATLLITISLTSIVWLTQALRYIDFIVNQGVSIILFLKLTILLIPSLLLTILPPAFFCAVIFTYNKMKTDSELVVMQASGLDAWRLTQPALRVALAVTLLAYFLALYVQPVSMRAFRDLQGFLRNNYVSILLQEGVFSTPLPGLTVFVRERNDDGTIKGLLVHDSRKPDNVVTMMADSGILVQTPSGPRFMLKNGTRQEMRNGRLSFLNYDSYTLDISLYTQSTASKSTDVLTFFLSELARYDDNVSVQENNKRRAEFHQRLLWPAYTVTLTFIALAWMLSARFSRRSNWRRLTAMIVFGVCLIFSSNVLRGVIIADPTLFFLLYLWWLLPTVIALLILLNLFPDVSFAAVSAAILAAIFPAKHSAKYSAKSKIVSSKVLV